MHVGGGWGLDTRGGIFAGQYTCAIITSILFGMTIFTNLMLKSDSVILNIAVLVASYITQDNVNIHSKYLTSSVVNKTVCSLK